MVSAPIYVVAITRNEVTALLLLLSVSALFYSAFLGITFGVFQNLLHSRMRATGSALLNGVNSLIGMSLGPPLVGALSTKLATAYGNGRGLSYAMALTAVIYLWAGLHYLLAARHVGPDMARVRAAEE